MWHRLRVIRFARTRRALGAPAVARSVPALISEVLEDRTLLTGLTDLSLAAATWSDLLGSQESIVLRLPVSAIAGRITNESESMLTRSSADTSLSEVELTSTLLQVDAQSNWSDLLNWSGELVESDKGDLQVLVTIQLDSGESFDSNFQFVKLSFDFRSGAFPTGDGVPTFDSLVPLAAISGGFRSELGLQLDAFTASANSAFSFMGISADWASIQQSADLETTVGAMDILRNRQSTDSLSSGDATQPTTSRGDVDEYSSLETDGATITSVGPFERMEIPFANSSAAEIDAFGANTVAELAFAPMESQRMIASLDAVDSPRVAQLAAVSMLPADGLQAAATPLVVVFETVLASVDTAARAVLALLTGSGGGTSPTAPIVLPIFDSTQVALDPKRPRWALHDGLVSELATYSLVVAPDQHFDLKDFGPASRAADTVVRIEFDLPPQHGQVLTTMTPGAFRYSADPGFSGVDSARFRATFASGQVVAGVVTAVVPDRGLAVAPAGPVRQVEVPLEDRRISESGQMRDASVSAEIDAGFLLSGGWLDLP